MCKISRRSDGTITDMQPFHRPFGAFPFCACLTGASPLPVFHRLSEALSFTKASS
ncbi:hypothetical protein HMPREF0658_1975 [Hoylesella marshii DSM 16973 = JCM 13450]|uniref:Uncharacterized protein n=1 Tax=Hoylesella marshii DSM 16973 = JCM 13450 TaxID=862515 RepID=E0NUX0_9BACT|nr:hypothetical protein HMPREF0658_1975 [Hoylesella marshii DSM 16973 = JCM 13450]